MDFLTDWLMQWLKELLITSILSNLGGLFDSVNTQVGEIASTVGMAPWVFNPGVFALIRNLSETVVLPIAGLLLTFVMTWELIHLIVDQNNLHYLDTWIFFKWVFKTMMAVVILSNTFDIVMAIFDVSQHVVDSAAGIITSSTAVSLDMLTTLEAELMLMDVGPLLGLWLQSVVIGLIVVALNIVVFVIVYGRMIEVFVLASLAPLPLATLTSREMGSMGFNYMKSLIAIGFQGLLIMVCIAIYAVMVQSIPVSGDAISAIWASVGYTVLLCFTLFKTGGVAKAVLGAF